MLPAVLETSTSKLCHLRAQSVTKAIQPAITKLENNFNLAEFKFVSDQLFSLHRDERKEFLPKSLILRFLDVTYKTPFDKDNFDPMTKLVCELSNDKRWEIWPSCWKIDKHFWTSEYSSYPDDLQVAVVKCVASLFMKLTEPPRVEEVEKYLNFSLDLLEQRLDVISGKLLGDLLWSIVQLRRCRMVTSATNYRKRESIQVLSDSVLGRIRDRIIAVAEDTSHYHLTMFPWALTSLGVWSIPAMDKVSEVLSREYEKLSQREMAMFLYCLSLAAHPNSKQFADICRDVFEQKHDILIDPLIPWALNILGFPWHPHPEMRFKEFPFKNDDTRLVRSSLVHMDIAKKLESIGLTLLNEVTVRGYSIDIAIDSKPKPIAIEVNGPVHYYQHCDGVKRLGGPSVLKARELKEEGWRVLNLDIKLYQKFPTNREKIHFLRKYIPRSVFAGVRT